MSFLDFSKRRVPPKLIYKCRVCLTGEAEEEEVVSIEEFREAGGELLLADERLELVEKR